MTHSTQVELQVGSTWIDLTAAGDVYSEDGITITRGSTGEGSTIDPGTCTLTLNNAGGKFSPRQPASPYYGLIGRNTPIRVSVAAGSKALNIPDGGAGRAKVLDTAAIDVTGDIDVRADLTPAGWAGVWDLQGWEVMAKYNTATNNRSWRLLANGSGTIQFGWSTTGADFNLVNSTAPVPFRPGQRGAIRATLDVDNGSGGWTLTFYTAPTMAGPWTQLGDPVTGAGTTSIFNSTANLEVGDITTLAIGNPARRYHSIQVRNGIGGTLVANPDFTAQTAGASSFTDGSGRTWLVEGTAAITNKHIRFLGEVSEWPPRWHPSGGDERVTIQAAGILRRLNQGSKQLQSTLRRRIPSDATLLAYWPLEEGQYATQAYSPLNKVRPMTITGVDWAADDTLAGSSALPAIRGGGACTGVVPAAPTGATTSWHTEFVFKCDAGPATSRTLLNWYTTGTVARWRLMLAGTNAELHGYDVDGTEIINDITFLDGFGVFGAWTRWRLFATQNGGNIDWTIGFVPIGGVGGSRAGTVAGTVGRITSVGTEGWHADIAGTRIGHVAAFSAANSFIYNSADHGFTGETAGARIDRLRTEEALPLTVYGDTTLQVPLGPQRPNALLATLQAAADADGGVLYEARDAAALRYRDRASHYNQAVGLALVYGAPGLAPPFEPVDDDRNVRNDRTVVRDGGSSARATLDIGPLSTQPPPLGVGRYDDSVTLSLATDDQCADQAGWRLHLGTWDEARYPSVRVSLTKPAAAPLIDPATAVDIHDRIQISNPPSSLPPDPISLVIEGYTETITPTTWDITYVCSPAGPWGVAHADDPVYGRADTDGSQLASSVTSTATTLSVATTAGPPWTTAPAEFPFDIKVGGEVMTVTNIVGTSSPQTFTVTRSVNSVVKAQSAGTDVRLAQPAHIAL